MAGSGTAHLRNNDEVVLDVRDIVVEFRVGNGLVVKAVSKISFDVCRGETLAIVVNPVAARPRSVKRFCSCHRRTRET